MRSIRGYTLLEIVIVIGILSLFVGSGMAAVVPFKERREVLSDARNMASLLKQTQVKASAIEIPSSCSNVGEFEIEFSGGGVNLLVKTSSGALCKQDTGVLNFSNGAEFVTAGSVIFKTPFGSANPVTVSICNYGIQYDLDVSKNGAVSEPLKSNSPGC
jgi:prepilin-type N-terminal cleavage/methylation domain-containing protein